MEEVAVWLQTAMLVLLLGSQQANRVSAQESPFREVSLGGHQAAKSLWCCPDGLRLVWMKMIWGRSAGLQVQSSLMLPQLVSVASGPVSHVGRP